MDISKYDFESALEQGFKSLFAANNMTLRVADDLDEGELPDECITLEVEVGAPISDEHLNAEGAYNNYGGNFTVEIKSNRVAGDQVSAKFGGVSIQGAGTDFINGDYSYDGLTANGKPSYTKSTTESPTGVINLWSISDAAWLITSTPKDSSSFPYYTNPSSSSTPPSVGWQASAGDEPAPTVSEFALIRNRHNQLVAQTRKTLEEITGTVLSENWADISPTKIKPTGTERENDNLNKMTTLSYELQFRIT